MLASRAVRRESAGAATGTGIHCSWWPASTEGCKTGKDPAGRVGFALHIFGGLELKYLEVGWGRSL